VSAPPAWWRVCAAVTAVAAVALLLSIPRIAPSHDAPVSTPSVSSTSRSTLDGRDYVVITSERVDGQLLSITFESFGAKDLGAPDASCLQDASGTQNPVLRVELTASGPTHYKGTLVLPAGGLQPPVSLLYACQAAYQPVTVIP
jgi:hypothetical protein